MPVRVDGAAQGPYGPAAPAAAPVSAPRRQPSTTPWSWLLAVAPLVLVVPAWGVLQRVGALLLADVSGSGAGTASPGVLDLALDARGVLGRTAGVLALVTVVSLVLAVVDTRRLRRLGVARPFPWAFGLVPVVYLVGRAVVVFRAQGSGSLLVAVTLACWLAAAAATAVEVGVLLLLHLLDGL